MNIISLCVYAILSVILILIIYRAYNYHFTENFTSKTPTSSNLSKIQKNVCPKPPPCPTCPIPDPCPSCPPHEPCPTCPIPEPCPTCPPPISDNKFTYQDYVLISKLGSERLNKMVMEHFENNGLLKFLKSYEKLNIIDSVINNNNVEFNARIYHTESNYFRDNPMSIPLYTNDNDCAFDLKKGNIGCIKLDSF